MIDWFLKSLNDHFTLTFQKKGQISKKEMQIKHLFAVFALLVKGEVGSDGLCVWSCWLSNFDPILDKATDNSRKLIYEGEGKKVKWKN